MAANDTHVGKDTPAYGAFDASALKSDTADFPIVARALFVGGTGNVKVKTWYNEDVTFTNVQDGFILPVTVRRLYSTGTTATTIVGLY